MPTTNPHQRFARFDAALEAHKAAQVAEGDGTVEEITLADRAQDLLTDYMHWCDTQGLDFDDLLHLADMAYRREIDPLPSF